MSLGNLVQRSGVRSRDPQPRLTPACSLAAGASTSHESGTGLRSRGYQVRILAAAPVQRRQPNGLNSKEYTAWANMVRRCEDDDAPNFRWYGRRGIKICARWRDSFDAFVADLGPAPTQRHTLGRKDGNGHYEPGNVEWQTWAEQGQQHCSACGRRGHNRLTCDPPKKRPRRSAP